MHLWICVCIWCLAVLNDVYHLYSVEKEALKASSEVLLVAKEDLVEVAHPSDEHPVVDVQLVEPARKFGSAVKVLLFYCSKKDIFLFWSWIFPAIWNFWKGDHVMLIWLAKLGGIQLAGVPFKFQSRQNVVCFVSNWQWIAFSEWHICSEDVRPSQENWTLISNPNSFNWQEKTREQQR